MKRKSRPKISEEEKRFIQEDGGYCPGRMIVWSEAHGMRLIAKGVPIQVVARSLGYIPEPENDQEL